MVTDDNLARTRPARPAATPLADLARLAAATTRRGRAPSATPAPPVTGVSLSSQRVLPGDLYAALPGTRAHGIDFAADAVAAGAVAVLTDHEPGPPRRPAYPLLVVDRPRDVLGGLAARVYGEPAAALRLIGVTGTQGKTTTTRLAEGGLQAAGEHGAVIGTVGTRVDGEDVKTALTTPEAPDLHGLFAMMRERGVSRLR